MANQQQMTVHSGKAQPFSAFLEGQTGKKLLSNVLNDPKRRMNFVSAIVPAVANNASIAACTNASICSCALKGEALGLPHSPELGYYYMVPFNQKAKYNKDGSLKQAACSTATFILGYRGLIQLALRSGQYKVLNCCEVYECEHPRWNRFTEQLEHDDCDDYELAESKVAGYYAYFELTNGFRKALYMSWEAVMRHACQYSHIDRSAWERVNNGSMPQNEAWKYSSHWYSDFDTMAKKTVIRQLLSKWGIMSVELQQAFTDDAEYNTPEEPEEVPTVPGTGDVIIDAAPAQTPATAPAPVDYDDDELEL